MKYYRNTGDFDNVRVDEKIIIDYMNSTNLIKIENVIVDKRLFEVARWECKLDNCQFNKKDNFSGTCCNGGGILSPVYESIVEKHLTAISKYLDAEKREKLENEKLTIKPLKMNGTEDECVFLAHIENSRYCALHKFALDNSLPVSAIKSFDCYMAPLEIIILDSNELFLTICTNETLPFLRWGGCLECMQVQDAKSPLVIESMSEVLIYIFGQNFYNTLCAEIVDV